MTEPVRVLYEIHPHTLGGTERFLVRFLGQLDRRRYEPMVISQKRGLPLQTINSLDIQTASISDYFRASGVSRLADFIRRNRVSLVQSNYYTSQLATASNLAGVPHVWRLGGHVDVGSGTRNPKDAGWALDIIRLLSNAVICNSKYVRSQFRGRSKIPPIQVIPNGIQVPVKASGVKRKKDFRVGMVAHFTPQKRHEDFIRAAEIVSASCDHVSFTIVGRPYADAASRGYAAEILVRARTLLKQRRLRISDFSEPGEDVLGGFDIIVLPSVRESFSNAILEAMAAGVPVVAARSGGNAELVEHRRTGLLVPPMQPEALARAILRLVEEPELTTRMGRSAREKARTQFSIDDCVDAYEAVYARLMSDSND